MIAFAGQVSAMLLLATGPVAADERVSAQDGQAAPVASPDAFTEAAVVSDGELGKVAGREDVGTSIAQANQRNTVSNNSVVGTSVTGNVVIDGNAFQNLQGLAVISANSGNNVAINSAMNVTINLRPMP